MILEKLTAVVDALKGAEVAATLDARDVNPPGAWVAANRVEDMTLCAEPIISANVVLVAPDHGAARATAELDAMLERALPALASVSSSIDDVSLSDTATLSATAPLPAFVVTVTI